MIVSVCYLQAAFELDTDYTKNTWGDSYDSYVQTDNSVAHHVTEKKQSTYFLHVPAVFQAQQFRVIEKFTADNFPSQFFPQTKLFIKSHSLLI